MKEISVWADGACRGNGSENSIGGCGVVLVCNGHRRELKSAQLDSTNNAQEIRAVILGLKAITQFDLRTTVYSDSAYVVNCVEAKWYKKWKTNGWKTSKNTPVLNPRLWIELLELVNKFDTIKFVHVKGHSNVGENERCDGLANEAMDELMNRMEQDEALQY